MQLQLHGTRQPRHAEGGLLKNQPVLALRHIGLAQRNHHFSTVDAQADSFQKRDLGRNHVTVLQQRLAQKHLHRQHAFVDLQCVFELDDGTVQVFFLVPDQCVFVVLGSFCIGCQSHSAAVHQGRQQGSQYKLEM